MLEELTGLMMYSVLTNCSWLTGEVCIDMGFQRESKTAIVGLSSIVGNSRWARVTLPGEVAVSFGMGFGMGWALMVGGGCVHVHVP